MKKGMTPDCITAQTTVQENEHIQINAAASSKVFALRPFLAALLLSFVLLLSACGNKEAFTAVEQVAFDQAKWQVKEGDQYPYRKTMIRDMLTNRQWTGMKKDVLIRLLGQPDVTEPDLLMYNYDSKPFLGGFGTAVDGISFELNPDSTVRKARLSDDGWD